MTVPESLAWYPWWVDRWMGSMRVRRMTFEQRGLYRHLLDLQWQSKGKIEVPMNGDRSATRYALAMRPLCDGILFSDEVIGPVLECFEKDSTHIWNKLLLEIWNESVHRVEGCRKGAQITNAKRYGQRSPSDTPSDTPSARTLSPSPSPSLSPEPTKEKSLVEQEFDVLWQSYPSKTGSKEKALLSWKKYRAQGDTVEQAAVGIAKYVAHVEQRRKTDFPKLDFQNGLTFFNGRGWKTEWEVKINDPSRRQSGMSMADLNKMIGERVCTDQIQPKECPPTAKKPSDPF